MMALLETIAEFSVGLRKVEVAHFANDPACFFEDLSFPLFNNLTVSLSTLVESLKDLSFRKLGVFICIRRVACADLFMLSEFTASAIADAVSRSC
jgi:hypothetical protein